MIYLQLAIPLISVTFNKEACVTPGAKINHCMVYCAGEQRQYSHFIVQTLIEDWLRTAREPFMRPQPRINLHMTRGGMMHVDRDLMFENGYSILSYYPGMGPVLHWGCPGDVHMVDLMGMATVIKTFEYYFNTRLKTEIAHLLQSSQDLFDIKVCRAKVQHLFAEVAQTATAQRIVYGRGELYVRPEDETEDEYFHMRWGHMAMQPYVIRVDFENFDLKYTVPQKLIDLFSNCFGSKFTYRMVPTPEPEEE